jgi:hypothetical protein
MKWVSMWVGVGVVISRYVNINQRVGPSPRSHQSVLTGVPFMRQQTVDVVGQGDVRCCLRTDLERAVFTRRLLQTQPSIPRGVKKERRYLSY